MSYKAFALQYRPQDFDEVVGQEQVVAALKNAITSRRVHHAYLFSGPRGVGKTSLARILAKALNCQTGPTPQPCGKCTSCEEITKGISLDVVEIDGASNRGIDEIRALREAVKLAPAYARCKIYIIDEVHMLTQEAFNALLKTLEEPPPHVKFIFATTHPQKLLPTILSRCQKFQFNLLPLEKIVYKLEKIIKREKLSLDSSLVYAIARQAAGSIRDAESLLDQLAPVVLEKGVVGDILSFLGMIDEDSLNTALQALVKKDLTRLLVFIDKIVKDGKDLGVFLNGLIEQARNLLLAKVSAKSFNQLAEISPQGKEFFIKLSRELSTDQILQIADLLIEAKQLSQRLNTVRVPLELAVVKFSQACPSDRRAGQPAPQPASPQTAPQGGPAPTKAPQGGPASPKGPSAKPAPTKAPQGGPASPPDSNPGLEVELSDEFDLEIDNLDLEKEESAPNSSEETEETEDNLLLPEISAKWQAIIAYLQKVRVAIASHLSFGRPHSSQGDCLKVAFTPKDYFHREIVASEKNRSFIETSITNFLRRTIKVKFITADLARESEPAPQTEREASGPPPDSDELVNDILDAFKGKLHSGED